MRVARALRGGGAVLGVLLLSGCHTYMPIERPAPGTTVRVRVPLTSAVERPNQSPETVSVEGLLVAFGDTLELEVTSRQEYGAFREVMRRDTLRIARNGITELEERVFSRNRSVGLGVALAGGATVLAAAALGLTGGDQGAGPDSGDDPSGAIIVASLAKAIWRLIGG